MAAESIGGRKTILGTINNKARIKAKVLAMKPRLNQNLQSEIDKSEISDKLVYVLEKEFNTREKIKNTNSLSKTPLFSKGNYKEYQILKMEAVICIEMFLDLLKTVKNNPDQNEVEQTSIWDYLKTHKANVYWSDVGGSKEKLQKAYEEYSPQLKDLFNCIQINGEQFVEMLNIGALIKLNFKGIINIPSMPDISMKLDVGFPKLTGLPSFTIPEFPNLPKILPVLQPKFPHLTLAQLKDLFSYIYILKQITIKLPDLKIFPQYAIELPKMDIPKIVPDVDVHFPVVKFPTIPVLNNVLTDFISDLVVSVPLFPLGVIKNVNKLYINGKKAYKAYKSSKNAHLSKFEKKLTSKLHVVLSDSIEGEYQTRCKEYAAKTARSAIELASFAVPGSSAVNAGMSIAQYGYTTYKFCSDWNDFRKLYNILSHPAISGGETTYPKLKEFVTYPALSCCVLTELDEATFVTAIACNGKDKDAKNNTIITELDSVIASSIRNSKISPEQRKEITSRVFNTWFKSLKEEATHLKEKFPYYVSTAPRFDNVYDIVKSTVEDEIRGYLFDSTKEKGLDLVNNYSENAAAQIADAIDAAEAGSEDEDINMNDSIHTLISK